MSPPSPIKPSSTRPRRPIATSRSHAIGGRPPATPTGRDLSVSLRPARRCRRRPGKLDQAAQAIATASRSALVAASDPSNTDWQRDLSVSHNKLGDVARAKASSTRPPQAYRDGLTIAKSLAASDPGNADWQRSQRLLRPARHVAAPKASSTGPRRPIATASRSARNWRRPPAAQWRRSQRLLQAARRRPRPRQARPGRAGYRDGLTIRAIGGSGRQHRPGSAPSQRLPQTRRCRPRPRQSSTRPRRLSRRPLDPTWWRWRPGNTDWQRDLSVSTTGSACRPRQRQARPGRSGLSRQPRSRTQLVASDPGNAPVAARSQRLQQTRRCRRA